MTAASDIPTAQDLLTQLNSLRFRLAKVAGASDIDDLFGLLKGTGLEGTVLTAARQSVADFLNVGINQIKAQLTALGVTGI